LKKSIPSFLAGVLITVMVFALSISALAITGVITIEGHPIDIIVRGKIFEPKDVNGNDVLVFEYKGTTYAPVRALAEAYGLEVSYNSEKHLGEVYRPGEKPVEKITDFSLTDLTYDEFRALLTLVQEFGDKSEYYDKKYVMSGGKEVPVALPFCWFIFSFDKNIDETVIKTEWAKFESSDNFDYFMERLLSEYIDEAPYNSVNVSVSINGYSPYLASNALVR